MTLEALNAMPRESFVDTLGWIFEDSPWVADQAWPQRPFASVADLHAKLYGVVESSDREMQLALLQAHPDLGRRARMSDASEGEQKGAGLDRLSPTEFAELQSLNAAYREKFGFPFLYAVKGSGKDAILAALRKRVSGNPEDEFRTALEQVRRIAWFRLEDLFSEGKG